MPVMCVVISPLSSRRVSSVVRFVLDTTFWLVALRQRFRWIHGRGAYAGNASIVRDGPRQHDDLARVAGHQREPSLRRAHADDERFRRLRRAPSPPAEVARDERDLGLGVEGITRRGRTRPTVTHD